MNPLTFRQFSDILHTTNPYDGFDFIAHSLQFESLMRGGHEAYASIVGETKPNLIIEVGTWTGRTAANLATAIRRHELNCGVVCVDTWLGCREHWTDGRSNDSTVANRNIDGRYASLGLTNGYPTVYFQFLANVCHLGLCDWITPVPLPSLIAARLLRSYGQMSELIHIDGSKDVEDVFADCVSYWQLVTDNGIMFGTDYDIATVKSAVDSFATDIGLPIEIRNESWWVIRKVTS